MNPHIKRVLKRQRQVILETMVRIDNRVDHDKARQLLCRIDDMLRPTLPVKVILSHVETACENLAREIDGKVQI